MSGGGSMTRDDAAVILVLVPPLGDVSAAC
jgi:hypothetical protein